MQHGFHVWRAVCEGGRRGLARRRARWQALPLAIIAWTAGAADLSAADKPTRPFYQPENPGYTIVHSVLDSLRFTRTRTLRPGSCGHWVSTSSFVNPEGEVMGWHDFGHLEGPGWAANTVGGAWELYRWGRWLGDRPMQQQALSCLDHVLECGFVDLDSGFIRGYRETTTGRHVLNYKHQSDWFCPGAMAKVAYQLLRFADDLPRSDPRRASMRRLATRTANWLEAHVEPVPNGWFARRVTPAGAVYRKSPDGGDDPLWQSSADGLFILQLQVALTERRLADYRRALREKCRVFQQAGGIFGSINHDTYDAHENVAYAVAFRTLVPAARLLQDDGLRAFAYNTCLAGLDQFKMTDDRHGVATRGLLFMEKSWDTAYLWENAEAALAYFEAAADKRADRSRARDWTLDGLTILRAAAKHHYGPHGFLTEGVDWNNHVGQQHHIGGAKYGAIQYTEPFLNNQHIAEPTLLYLERLAKRRTRDGQRHWFDFEGNRLLSLPRRRRALTVG